MNPFKGYNNPVIEKGEFKSDIVCENIPRTQFEREKSEIETFLPYTEFRKYPVNYEVKRFKPFIRDKSGNLLSLEKKAKLIEIFQNPEKYDFLFYKKHFIRHGFDRIGEPNFQAVSKYISVSQTTVNRYYNTKYKEAERKYQKNISKEYLKKAQKKYRAKRGIGYIRALQEAKEFRREKNRVKEQLALQLEKELKINARGEC